MSKLLAGRCQKCVEGLAIRRQVLGDKYVDAAMNSVTDFNRPLQELLNEYC